MFDTLHHFHQKLDYPAYLNGGFVLLYEFSNWPHHCPQPVSANKEVVTGEGEDTFGRKMSKVRTTIWWPLTPWGINIVAVDKVVSQTVLWYQPQQHLPVRRLVSLSLPSVKWQQRFLICTWCALHWMIWPCERIKPTSCYCCWLMEWKVR